VTPPESDLSYSSGSTALQVVTPNGTIIRDLTATELTNCGLTVGIVIYASGNTRGLVIITNTTPVTFVGCTIASGVVINILRDVGFGYVAGTQMTLTSTGQSDKYVGIATTAQGLTPQRGIDSRHNVGSTDGSPITVYAIPSTSSNNGYRLTARIFGFGGTVSSGIYEIKWTEGGVAITKDLSITAVDTDADLVIGIQPDSSTNVTAQLKTLTGTNPKVNVLCLVEGLDTGT
jgi:hypothetical protein